MIIGIFGRAGAGKDTFSDYLVKKHDFIKIAFADKIKRILMDLYGFNYNQLWGPSAERALENDKGLTVRLCSQKFGDCGRELSLDTWTDYCANIIDKLHNVGGYSYLAHTGLQKYNSTEKRNVIVSDCRYLNEILKIKELGGFCIRIKKSNNGLHGSAGQHSSEKDQDNIKDSVFDEIIVNDGTLEDLYNKVDYIFGKYK